MANLKTDHLRAFYDRRHPLYVERLPSWLFQRATYKGGREWFSANVFKFYKEGDTEFRDRRDRAYRFNHTREAVDLVQKYLFKAEISRNEEEAPDVVKEFWKNATLENNSIDQVMRLAATSNSIGGRVAFVVDNNLPAGAVTVAEAKTSTGRIYVYTVNVEDILDYAYDEDGDGGLLWVKLREVFRDDADPINGTGDCKERIRLWTRSEWVLYEEIETVVGRGNSRAKTMVVKELRRDSHDLGVVPVIFCDHTIGNEQYAPPSLIDDIAYLDRAVANYLSNLDAIIQDQTFSQLVMPAQGVMPGTDAHDALLDMGTKRLLIFDGGAGSTAAPAYISPDPRQAGIILQVIEKIINEIYHTIGLAGERTKQDNAVGIDNSSGVAKAYDFERVNSLLSAKAQSLENAENKIIELVCKWAGVKAPAERLVKYPTSFDVMRLTDELAIAERLAKIQAPLEVRREHMKLLTEKLFSRLKADIKQKMIADVNDWLEGTDVVLNPPTSFGAVRPPRSRQGQVTASTP